MKYWFRSSVLSKLWGANMITFLRHRSCPGSTTMSECCICHSFVGVTSDQEVLKKIEEAHKCGLPSATASPNLAEYSDQGQDIASAVTA